MHQLHFTGIVIDHSIGITQNKCLNIVIDHSIGITQNKCLNIVFFNVDN
jgi:hypothetical protein